MKKIILFIFLSMPIFAQAGIISFLGDVSSISSAMNSGQQSYSQSDLKKVNKYLWWHVKNNKKLDGYEFLAEALEQTNNASYLDTVAQTYYINGQKEKAIELYETRILPTARATCSSCEGFYKKIKGLSDNQKIPYSDIYKKQKEELKSILKKEEQESLSKIGSENFSVNFAIWGILIVLLLNFLVNTLAFLKSKKLKS